MRRVYLAGPEVFFADAAAILRRKAKLARAYGFEPIVPGDAEEALAPAPAGGTGAAISRHNELLIERADVCVANLTPFRGVSADPGTVFELGYAVALGRTVFGYTDDPRDYRERIGDAASLTVAAGELVEDHGMADNLMIEGALVNRGWALVRAAAPTARPGVDLAAYERCLGLARSSG